MEEERYRVRATVAVTRRFTEEVEVDDPTDWKAIYEEAMEKHGAPTEGDEIEDWDIEGCETVYDPEEDRYWRMASAAEDRMEERRLGHGTGR